MYYLKKLDIKLIDGDFENPLNDQIRTPEDLFTIFRDIKDFGNETLFVVYFFDNLTAFYDIHSHGPASMSMMSMKDILGRGYAMKARYFALVHNHPSGRPEPSTGDRRVMGILERSSGNMLELDMIDFVIVGDESYWSLSEERDKDKY